MLSSTAVTSPECPGRAMTLLLCREYSINHQELVSHQEHVPLKGPVSGIDPEDWMTHKTQALHLLHMQPYSTTAASCDRTTPKSYFNAGKGSHLEKWPPSWIFGLAK